MSCDWGQDHRYVPLRERFKAGQEYEVNGEKVTVYEVDLERMVCIVRPHSNPVNLVAIEMEDLE
jgi:hypothetical protein